MSNFTKTGSQTSELAELTDAELGLVFGGKITQVHVNGGGNTPNGNANGVPTENQNPSGHAPPGQN
jgi:hypothetical protein